MKSNAKLTSLVNSGLNVVNAALDYDDIRLLIDQYAIKDFGGKARRDAASAAGNEQSWRQAA